jgi:hypothetical protein
MKFFAHLTETDGRQYWSRLIVSRYVDGLISTTTNDCSLALGRRLADKLCDKYGIEDRAGLYCGRIFNVPGVTQC